MSTTAVKPPDAADSSRVDEVYEQVLLRIVRGELTAGTELKSTQIAMLLGLSRTPVVQRCNDWRRTAL
jgi:DNA-binding GntR family transcriptional regulator